MAENCQMFPKKFWGKLLTLLFLLQQNFSKKVGQLQKYSYFTKFSQFWTILHSFPLENHHMGGKRQIAPKMFLDNLST